MPAVDMAWRTSLKARSRVSHLHTCALTLPECWPVQAPGTGSNLAGQQPTHSQQAGLTLPGRLCLRPH
eukprot:1968321-Amphidinium_carterae.1